MKVKELINRLKLEDSDKNIRFYFLEHNVLQGCQLETILEADNQVEMTIQTEEELWPKNYFGDALLICGQFIIALQMI